MTADTNVPGIAPDDATLRAVERAACELIREAGGLVLDRYGGPLRVDYKDKNKADPVTEVDRAVEAYLTDAVARRFPDHAVLGEEGQEPEGEPEWEWIVDPVDGTLNYVHGLPLFAISIGVLHHRLPVVGALFFPKTGELLHARRGGGAFRDGEPLGVAPVSRLDARSLGGLPGDYRFAFSTSLRLRRRLGDFRALGSIAYEMGLVAAGSLDYAAFRGPKIWDVAGGATIVREAGGLVLAWDRDAGRWLPLDRFHAPLPKEPGKPVSLRGWSRPVLIGAPEAVRAIAPHMKPRYLPSRLVKLLRRYRA